jgi:hypothetical protein
MNAVTERQLGLLNRRPTKFDIPVNHILCLYSALCIEKLNLEKYAYRTDIKEEF